MGSEKRSLENMRIFGAFGLVLGFIANLDYYFKYKGIKIPFFNNIDINSISIMMIFSIIALGIFSISNIKLNAEEDILIEVKKKTIILKIVCILFVVYSMIIAILSKDPALVRIEILAEIILILIYIIERKIKLLQITDRQLKWKRDYEYPGSYNKESNIFWRMKSKFSPHIKVKWKDRINRVRWIKLLLIIFLLSGYFDKEFYIFLILFIPDFIYFFEVLFGLYTKTSGICTGVVETTKGSTKIPVYRIYITDYENEYEIAFSVRDYCYIAERDEVVVVHSMITKRVIEVQGIRMDIL
ncbi:hypothetical protein PMY38_08995 [Clostridium tertium]|jgi:hypothetical protein|uniref:Uncharacterized protein n=1 Tax=Clostridium tertium TaxID=1559 RepID=A0A9X3XKT0_9CLOT|nr:MULTISPECIES: hypothetical protein [Clostridium]EEH97292.1 hypothetical protein CSBG_00918 [Clostridium sp. 7_2_43FAA]MBU6134822.1 hypothetical protein [Clostridium tertium]MDB1956153.1 hypothetical protein [Clostridium tertium]MDB1958730.1 hypothetical protein [Clostridium tertium]MDB1962021.1 hypothetical protein [Clostridium tertium]